MNETEYAYAVARIRAKELELLTGDDIRQMISAPDSRSAKRIPADKGWDIPESGAGTDIYETELEKAWKLIAESVPDKVLPEALIIGNDFFNLKAAIKCTFSDIDPAAYYTRPCITDPEIITKAISEADFSLLPAHLEVCAESAYHAVSKYESGQLAESIIDRASLKTKLEYAEKSGSPLLVEIAKLNSAAADIKTALRCASMGKSREFAFNSMCGYPLDSEALLDNAEGAEKISEYLASTEYAFLADSVKAGFTESEKFCDNEVAELIRKEKYEIYGADPVAAYYYAKLAEVKNVRIILSAKASGASAEAISERMRDMYV